MANAKGSASIRNPMQHGKNSLSLLPPKSPFPSISSPYTDYIPSTTMGLMSKCRDGNAHHHRTSSESFIEEQPQWLDELLDEPETPVRRGHRRSSSDSFAYVGAPSMSALDYVPATTTTSHDESRFRPMASPSLPMWGSQNLDLDKEGLGLGLGYGKPKNRVWDPKLGMASSRDSGISQASGPSAAPSEADPAPSTAADKQDRVESAANDSSSLLERKDGSHVKSFENDTKRAKQQFAQRSRVRKLQYIAELERNVQAIQAEGSEISAELEFLNQQNLILSMENKALKQRLESLAQEKLIKYLEHEVLEREISRLRALYQQQQLQQPQLQQQQPHQRQYSSGHRRANSRDLDSQFASLSIKHKEASSGSDPVSGPIHI